MSASKVKENKDKNTIGVDNRLPKIASCKLVPTDEIEGSDIEDKNADSNPVFSPINIRSIVPIPIPIIPVRNHEVVNKILNGKNKWHKAALIGIKRIYPNADINTVIIKSRLDQNINIFANLAKSRGKTPKNTLSRVLQELRDMKLVIFVDNLGKYKLSQVVIDALPIIP